MNLMAPEFPYVQRSVGFLRACEQLPRVDVCGTWQLRELPLVGNCVVKRLGRVSGPSHLATTRERMADRPRGFGPSVPSAGPRSRRRSGR